jgi:uncharacterized membrane protein YccC
VRPRASTPSWRVRAATAALAVLVAGSVALGLGISHPYWAMVAAVVPFGASELRGQVGRGVQRLVGTLAGLIVAALVFSLEPTPWMVVLLAALLQAGAELLVTRNYGLALLVITPLALLVSHAASPGPVPELLAARLIETLVGVAAGVTLIVGVAHLQVRFASQGDGSPGATRRG